MTCTYKENNHCTCIFSDNKGEIVEQSCCESCKQFATSEEYDRDATKLIGGK